jgi:glucokinase-like ROK family protein
MENNLASKRVSRMTGLREVFDVIRTESPISRIRLASLVSVSRATLSGIVCDLIETGFLEETGEQTSTGGRPAVQLSYRPDCRFAVGVVQYDTQLRATLTDFEGRPLYTLETPFYAYEPDAMLHAITGLVNRVLIGGPLADQPAANRQLVVGVGVGVPGLVDFSSGTLVASVSKGWLDGKVAVREVLSQALGLPVYVVNRSRVAALGEHQVGAGRGTKNLIYVFIGQGIAAGIILDGKLYLGSKSSSGEIGHVVVNPSGPLCRCGSQGCLEVYATEAALLAAARARVKADPANPLYQNLDLLAIADLIQAARNGNPAAQSVFDEAGSKIGSAVATLINLFDPELVILGGPIGSAAGEVLLQPVIQETRRRTIPRSFANTRITAGELGTEAATIGAAVLAISQNPIEALLGQKG